MTDACAPPRFLPKVVVPPLREHLAPERAGSRNFPPLVEQMIRGANAIYRDRGHIFDLPPHVPKTKPRKFSERRRKKNAHGGQACALYAGALAQHTDLALWRAMHYGGEIRRARMTEIAKTAGITERRAYRAQSELVRHKLAISEQPRTTDNETKRITGEIGIRALTKLGIHYLGIRGTNYKRAKRCIDEAEAKRKADRERVLRESGFKGFAQKLADQMPKAPDVPPPMPPATEPGPTHKARPADDLPPERRLELIRLQAEIRAAHPDWTDDEQRAAARDRIR